MASRRRHITTGSSFERDLAYSRAVVQGDWCFVSGVTGYDYKTMSMPEGARAQAAQAFATIASVMAEAGFAMSDIVRVQYTLVDGADVAEIAPVLRDYLDEVRPAATMVLAGLIDPAMKVEIEVTAFRG